MGKERKREAQRKPEKEREEERVSKERLGRKKEFNK